MQCHLNGISHIAAVPCRAAEREPHVSELGAWLMLGWGQSQHNSVTLGWQLYEAEVSVCSVYESSILFYLLIGLKIYMMVLPHVLYKISFFFWLGYWYC